MRLASMGRGTVALDYTDRDASFEWYRKAKQRGVWDPESFDLEQDKADWETEFTDDERYQFVKLCSLFYEGEESVTRTLAPYPLAVGALEAPGFDSLQEEMFLTTQLWEESKHTEFFSRYFKEVFGTQDTDYGGFEAENFWNPELQSFLIDDLEAVSDELRRAVDADQATLVHTLAEAVAHYMGIVEAELARVGYKSLAQMLDAKGALPGFQAAIEKIEEDEGRHIANGRWLMAQLAEIDPTVVEAVYEPMFERFFDDLLGPTVMNIMGDNPLGIDADLLFRTAQGNYQSTVDSIGAERFEADVSAAGD
jgi:ribonucleoside-diphosphate reductase beta chain